MSQLANITFSPQIESVMQSRMTSMLDSLPSMMFTTAPDGSVDFVNLRCAEALGVHRADLMGGNWGNLLHSQDRQRCIEVVQAAIRGRCSYEFECRIARQTRKNDSGYAEAAADENDPEAWRWWRVEAVPRYSSDGEYRGQAGSVVEITDRKRAEDRLARASLYDALTGIANRTLLLDRIGHCIARRKRNPEQMFGVMCLDLDRFKNINDSVGHAAGDELLLAFTKRLMSCLRPSDTVARLGGDEFAILLEEVKDASDFERISKRIHNVLDCPFQIEGNEVFVSASIGIAIASRDLKHALDILRDADIAMYRAKAQGKARHEVFQQSMHASAVDLLRLENDLRRAVDRNEFEVYYQPIVSIEGSRLESLEALVRWNHPERGVILPTAFVPVAEETGLIVQIGRTVLRQACQQLQRWQRELPLDPLPSISVNLSPRQFSQPDLVDQIMHALMQTQLSPNYLRIEITESVLMTDAQSSVEMLRRLKAQRIQVSIDDFGTGYSSLGYLHRLPVDMIKIDRGFIARLVDGGSGDFEIVRAIIALAHGLRMKVTAEGIESVGQLNVLRELGCEYVQGYMFSKPVDAATMTRLLTEGISADRALPYTGLRISA